MTTNSELKYFIKYWFGTQYSHSAKPDLVKQWINVWFAKGDLQMKIDQELKIFEPYLTNFINYKPVTHIESISLMILYDQIPRNIYRKSAKAYLYDNIAQQHAISLILQIDTINQIFYFSIIICLIHSENIEYHHLAKTLFDKLNTYPTLIDKLKVIMTNHSDRITLFGRIPERNKYLNRPSTNEELCYMNAI